MNFERRDTAAWLCMQTGRANAINASFLDRLAASLDTFETGDASSLVLTGSPGVFSAGLDLPALIDLPESEIETLILRFSEVMMRLFSVDRPVVAAINGHAIAGGCVLALQADYRIMAEGDLRIGLKEVPLGIGLPAAVLETLRCQVPPASMLPVALEGRLFSPQEALAVGLIHEVVPLERLTEAAQAKAQSLGSLPYPGFSQVKRAMRRPVHDMVRSRFKEDAREWLSTWTAEPAQRLIRETVRQLAAKKTSA